MPGGDGTGPRGMGPGTGWGRGGCVPWTGRRFGPVGAGLGFGWGRGGRGRGRMFGGWAGPVPAVGWPGYGVGNAAGWALPTPVQERELLTQQLNLLQEQLRAVEQRLSEIGETDRAD